MFTNKYLPKSDNYYQRNYIVENNYNLPKEENPVIKDSLGISYFPSLDYSISTKEKKASSGSDIADVITNDKLKFLGATAEHLKSQIDQRAKIRDDHVNDLDSMIMDCDTGVMNLESWPMFSNQMVEKKRADFKNVIQKLESEKKQEVLKCWKDQSSLYKELLETLGEYKNVQRRSKNAVWGILRLLAEEICVKLRPILGERVDRLWRAYLVEDTDGKREIEQILNMLYVDNMNTDFSSKNIDILVPPPTENVRGEYPIGQVTYANKKLYPFCLREHDWIKHVLIVGASGSGKTNLCFQVLKNFIHKRKPFLVLDWKRNYRDIITESYGKDVRIYTVGRDVAPFRFNPMIPPPGTSAKTWLKKLIEIIAHATYVGEGVMYLLQKALDKTYRDFGLYGSKPVVNYPTLKDLLTTIESTDAKGREAGWMSSTLRALGALTFGETGKTFNVRQQSDMVDLLNHHVILEMDSLTNTDKIFLVESILLWIHHYRLSSPSQKREEFDHAIILEEAHHVIGKDKSDLVGGESITDVIIREIRELGESVIIIDQCPSLLSLPARGNTWCTIVLNLKDAKDVNSAASSLLLEASDKKVLGRLDIGEAVAKIQGRWHKPFMIHIPHIPIRKGSVNDKMISESMRPYSTYSTSETVTTIEEIEIPRNEDLRKIESGITSEEQLLVQDIYSNKLSGVVERYKRLRWSRRKGNELKNSLLKKQFIDTEEIPTKSGRVIVLKLTKEGKRICSEPITEKSSDLRVGGVTHEYWKNKYAQILKDKGFDITFEKPIGEGKSVDVVATKKNIQIAIEVETGRSDILANINKCLQANFDRIIVVAINEKIESKIKSLLEDNDLHQNPKIILSCARRTA